MRKNWSRVRYTLPPLAPGLIVCTFITFIGHVPGGGEGVPNSGPILLHIFIYGMTYSTQKWISAKDLLVGLPPGAL